jgi:DMSO/TMAO reductase YedYZ molybdopterin-dependent catalytic subunit
MKHILILVLLCSLLLASCRSAPVAEEGVPTLTVTDGVASKIYTAEDLQKLVQAQAEDKGVIYLGVAIVDLLHNAGYDPDLVVIVQAIASDGFTADYDQILFRKSDTLLAYARLDEALSDDEGPFRMVLPGQVGKLNPRMVVELLVKHP